MRKKKTYAMKRGGGVKPRMMKKGGNVKPRMMKKGGNVKPRMMSKGGAAKKTMTIAQLRAEAKKKGMKLVKDTKKA
jgi:hypothetical protein|tara:strand:- start:377 stop:604 length:228 start_codon:yes stop_codon:yes gene_type:complete